MTALGEDIGGVEDVDPYLSMVDGRRAAGQAVMSSLLHGPGILWWAPDSGHDLRSHLHSDVNNARIRLAVVRQCELDERVSKAIVSIERFGASMQIFIDLLLTSDEASVTLTLTIDDVGKVLDAIISG